MNIHIKKAITVFVMVFILVIAPFWYVCIALFEVVVDIKDALTNPKTSLNTLYNKIWAIKKASEK
jgi:hypothetical protein